MLVIKKCITFVSDSDNQKRKLLACLSEGKFSKTENF